MDLYTVRVFSPTTPSEGKYDLKITLSIGGKIKDYDIEPNAVILFHWRKY